MLLVSPNLDFSVCVQGMWSSLTHSPVLSLSCSRTVDLGAWLGSDFFPFYFWQDDFIGRVVYFHPEAHDVWLSLFFFFFVINTAIDLSARTHSFIMGLEMVIFEF